MDIEFSTNRLATASLSLTSATRLFGTLIGRKYIQRLVVIRAVDEFTQLFGLRARRLHPLTGGLAHRYAMTITGNFRLIVERVIEDTVHILSVEDYHGD